MMRNSPAVGTDRVYFLTVPPLSRVRLSTEHDPVPVAAVQVFGMYVVKGGANGEKVDQAFTGFLTLVDASTMVERVNAVPLQRLSSYDAGKVRAGAGLNPVGAGPYPFQVSPGWVVDLCASFVYNSGPASIGVAVCVTSWPDE